MQETGGVYLSTPGQPNYKLGQWLGDAWRLFKARILELVALILLGIVPMLVLMAVVFPLQFAVMGRAGEPPSFRLVPTGMDVLTSVIAALVSAAVYTPFMVGAAAVVLNYVRAGLIDWGLIWTGYRKWSSSLLLGIWPGGISTVCTLFPVLAILVPVWLAVLLWTTFATFSLSESGTTYSQAVDHGLRLIKISFWQAVLFYLVAVLVSISGIVACCIGVLFTSALFQVLVAVAYNDLTRSMPLTRGAEFGT